MHRTELENYLNQLLESTKFKDYCPNGLQVEGKPELRRIVCGVTACQALLDEAVACGADALLVHHGYFWRGEAGTLTGFRRKRIATLLGHDINLFAYHLPLDAHPELGNNAQLGKLMAWQRDGNCGEQDLVWLGRPSQIETAWQMARLLAARLGREPILVGDENRKIERVAWCTGAAQGFFEAALAGGADAFVSGEISEQTVHLAHESGMPYLAVGHHASERYGVQALGAHLAERFGLDVSFVDVPNPA